MRHLACLLALAPALLFSQNRAKPIDNQVFAEDVRTVQLHLNGNQLSAPIVNLDAAPGTLVLEFDGMGGEIQDYWYTLVHCDADWRPSELDPSDYIDGFTKERILDPETSINTLVSYVHYTLRLPNASMKWHLSGNYIIKVWADDADETPVLTRRFMVVEPGWRVEGNYVLPANVSKQDTHHEVDLTVIHEGTQLAKPLKDVRVYVLQNLRWDTERGPFYARSTTPNGLRFDYQDSIVFPAGKELRFFDMRQFLYHGRNVRQINEQDDYYEVSLQPDIDFADRPFQESTGDINGRFYIENLTPSQTTPRQCEYARVLFSLKKQAEAFDRDVYVYGELTDWQLKPEFKMEYDYGAHVYWCEVLLKQGFYNHEFVAFNKDTGKLEYDYFSGNSWKTSNTYTLLVYYRPFGQRYERLMVAGSFDWRPRK